MWSRGRLSISNKKRAESKVYQRYLKRQSDMIVERGGINTESEVLELGSYPGTMAPHLVDRCRLTLSDISIELLEERIENCKYIKAMGDNIPLPDNSLDLLFMIDVFHHMLDFDAFSKEAKRVLKPEGRLLIFEARKYHPLVIMSNLIHGKEKEPYGLALFINREFIIKKLSNKFTLTSAATFNSFFGFKCVLFPNFLSPLVNAVEENIATPMHDVLLFTPRSEAGGDLTI